MTFRNFKSIAGCIPRQHLRFSINKILLKQENEHARRSERMIDDQINIAVESRETLMSQRVAFKAIQVNIY